MLQRLEISGIHVDVDDNLRKYITRKIGRMDKYLPRSSRESAHAEVRLKEATKNAKKSCICEVTMHVPGDQIIISEGTVNMYAAVDIVETKLKNQIKRMHERSNTGGAKRHLFARFNRKHADDAPSEESEPEQS